MEANFQIMIVHTGISDQQVIDFVVAGIKLYEQNKQKVVLFFDEVSISYYFYFNKTHFLRLTQVKW